MFDETDYNNIIAVVSHAYQNGMVKSADDAKVLLVLEGKCKQALHELTDSTEVTDGDDIPSGNK